MLAPREGDYLLGLLQSQWHKAYGRQEAKLAQAEVRWDLVLS